MDFAMSDFVNSHDGRITSDAKTRYDRDGFFVIKGLYEPSVMAAWKKQIVRRIEAVDPDKVSKGMQVWRPSGLDPAVQGMIGDDRLVAVLRSLIGPNVEFLSVKPVFKNRETSFASPWHQDWFYWRGSHKVSVWICLDGADRFNGCLKVLPTSHRSVAEMVEIHSPNTFVKQIPETDINEFESQTLELKAGDAVFFHDLLVHSSYPNTNGRERWALIPTYRDASISDDSTTWDQAMLLCGRSVNGAKPSGENSR